MVTQLDSPSASGTSRLIFDNNDPQRIVRNLHQALPRRPGHTEPAVFLDFDLVSLDRRQSPTEQESHMRQREVADSENA